MMKTWTVMASGGASSTKSSESRGEPTSCYFPGCRKDTNCHCDICLASINATLDLLPQSCNTSLTKRSYSSSSSSSYPSSEPPRTPACTPKPVSFAISSPETPTRESTAKPMAIEAPIVQKEASWAAESKASVLLLVLCLVLVVHHSVHRSAAFSHLQPKLTAQVVSEEVRSIGGDLRRRIELLQKRIEEVAGATAVDCSSFGFGWEFHQQGQHLFRWRCVIYKSLAEEVSIWGSPLRSSGLLPTTFSPRWLTILSGRITEWSEGRLTPTMRTSNNSSWTCNKWSKTALQLEANTWVLEYQRSALSQEEGWLQTAGQMLRSRALRTFQELKEEPLLFRLLRAPTYPSMHQQDFEEETSLPT